MSRALLSCLVLASLSLSGCVAYPIPHAVQLVPLITGVVTDRGHPTRGAVVYFVPFLEGDTCKKSPYWAETGVNGKFRIPEKRHIELLLVLGDRLVSWAVCVEYNGVTTIGMREHGIGYPPADLRIACELAEEARENSYFACKADGP